MPQDLRPHPVACVVAAPAQPPPYPTEFRFRNDSATPLFINRNMGLLRHRFQRQLVRVRLSRSGGTGVSLRLLV